MNVTTMTDSWGFPRRSCCTICDTISLAAASLAGANEGRQEGAEAQKTLRDCVGGVADGRGTR